MLHYLVNLIYPNLCTVCRNNLLKDEKFICINCLGNLPYTNFHTVADNPVEKTFWGRANINRAFAMLYFNNKGAAQRLLHALKYDGNKELAHFLGFIYGRQLAESGMFKTDVIAAIPLHSSKLRQRGYNQSEWFAAGLCESLGALNCSDAIIRNVATATQTKKTRIERWQNVEQIFSILNPEKLTNKHVLLVDDVITTGATIEACVQEIGKLTHTKISIAAIAFVN